MRRVPKKRLTRCGRTGLVVLEDELEAKLVLAKRFQQDRGETRYFSCGNHYHLSATEWNEGIAH